MVGFSYGSGTNSAMLRGTLWQEVHPMSKRYASDQIDLVAYNIQQAAAALGLDEERVSGLIRVGVLPHIVFGNRRVVGKRALEEWLTAACLANATAIVTAAPVRQTRLRPRRPGLPR
jgi:hypothetical protein